MTSFAVAASSTWIDEQGVRQPAGEVHAWLPGTNQTVCRIPLARAGLTRFPHVRWTYRITDVVTAADEVRYICRRCAGAARRRHDERRSWVRVSPRP